MYLCLHLIVVTGINNQSSMKAPMPSISEPAGLPSLPRYEDAQSTSSTPALDYKATVDGFSAPNLFDWTPTQDSTQVI